MGPVWFGDKTGGRGGVDSYPSKEDYVSFQGSGTAHFLRRSPSPGHSCPQGWGLAQRRPTSEGQVGLLILANLITPVLASVMGTCPAVLGSQISLERRPRTKGTEAQRPRSLSAGMAHTPPPAPARDGPSSCLHAVSDQELRPLPQVGLAESRTADPSIMIPCPASAPPKCPEPRAFCPGALLSCHCCPVGPGSGPLPCPLLPGCAGRRTRVCSPVKYPGAALVRLGNVVLRQES